VAQYDDLHGEWWKPRGAFAMLHWIAAARATLIPRASSPGYLVFNMHCSITGALASLPDELARALGVLDSFFAMRDRVLAAAAGGAFYAVAMSERGSGSRPSGVTTVEDTWDALGMRATGSQDLHLDVLAAPDSLLGGVEALTLLLAQVMPQWLVASYAAVYVGVAQSAVDHAVRHAQERNLSHLPAVRARLGRADAQVAAARLVVLEAVRRVDADPGTPETNRWIGRARLTAGETAMEVAASMLEAAGTSAMRKGHPLERIYRDARCGSLQPATSDVCADWLGMTSLGLDPDGGSAVPRW
jgi:alkylation response protein AidB-like acyl-CoA dehydrogenase